MRRNTVEEPHGRDDVERKTRRLTINLPVDVFGEIQELADEAQLPMNILMRNAFALVKIYYDRTREGQKMVFLDESGKPDREIVLPR